MHVLVSIGHHCAAAIPSSFADNVYRCRKKRICVAHHRADIEIVFPVLDRHMKWVSPGVEIGDDGLARPITIRIDHIASIAIGQEFGIEVSTLRPRFWMGPDPHSYFGRELILGF